MAPLAEQHPRLRDLALAAVLLASWSLVHGWLLRRCGLLAGVVGGELDLLVAARAQSAGARLDALVGSIHGYEVGSYLAVLLEARLLDLGFAEIAISRTLAGMAGAAGVLATAALAAGLAGPRPVGRRRAALVAGLIAALFWPSLHSSNFGFLGTTAEAWPWALASAGLLLGARRATRFLAGGAFAAVAWMFSPVAVLAGPVLAGAISCTRSSSPARGLGWFLAGATGVVLVVALAVPAGTIVLLKNLHWTAGAPAALLGFGFGGGGDGGGARGWMRLHTVLGMWGGVGPAAASGFVGSALATGGLLAGHLAASIDGGEGGPHLRARVARWAWFVLPWLLVLPPGPAAAPQGARYWILFQAVELALVASMVFAGGARAIPRLALAAVAVGGFLAWGSLHEPRWRPAREPDVWVTLGAHRMVARELRDRALSEYSGTWLALRPGVPPERRAAVALGFGLGLASHLEQGYPVDPDGWDTGLGDAPLEAGERAALVHGLGCGIAMSGTLHADAVEVLRFMQPADCQVLRSGWATCAEGLGLTPPVRAGQLEWILSAGVPPPTPEACPEFPPADAPPHVRSLWTMRPRIRTP